MDTHFLTQIDERIIISGRDTRYALPAYSFTLSSLDYHRSKSEELGHIAASDLVKANCELALIKFGPMANSVFSQWGVLTPLDIGNIIYNLIDIEILSKSDEDSLDDFSHLPALFIETKPENSFQIDKDKIKVFIDS
jgi:uncharacterized repeat protein (TIGR04138 family)